MTTSIHRHTNSHRSWATNIPATNTTTQLNQQALASKIHTQLFLYPIVMPHEVLTSRIVTLSVEVTDWNNNRIVGDMNHTFHYIHTRPRVAEIRINTTLYCSQASSTYKITFRTRHHSTPIDQLSSTPHTFRNESTSSWHCKQALMTITMR